MGMYDNDAWYLIIFGLKDTPAGSIYKGVKAEYAYSEDDARNKFHADRPSETILDMIYCGQTPPVYVPDKNITSAW